MLSTMVSLLMLFMPLGRQQSAQLLYEVRASPALTMGKGVTSGLTFYDVVITRQPNSGVLFKLDYSRRNTSFSFDLHHRLKGMGQQGSAVARSAPGAQWRPS